jgi:SAM-dependent methyltransferase
MGKEIDMLRENMGKEIDMLRERLNYGSPEENRVFLHNIYQTLLQRTPDEIGYKHYSQALQCKQLTRQDILNVMIDSAESQQEFYKLSIQPPEALHRARELLIQQCLPPASLIVDLGGAAHEAPEGALLAMGYPHHPQKIIIIDLPPTDRIGGITMAEPSQDIVTDNGVCVRYHYNSMADMSPIADQSIDLVFSGESIEHITEANADIVCQEAYRILKPGGYFCLDTPNAALTRLQSPNVLTHPEHKKEYYVHELRSKLEHRGFIIVEEKGICPMPESLRNKVFDYHELVQNIALSDNPEEGYLFFLKAIKPQEV